MCSYIESNENMEDANIIVDNFRDFLKNNNFLIFEMALSCFLSTYKSIDYNFFNKSVLHLCKNEWNKLKTEYYKLSENEF